MTVTSSTKDGDQIYAEGAVVVWDSGDLPITNVMAGLTAIQHEKLFPNRNNAPASLSKALRSVSREAYNPASGEPIEPKRLQGRVGFDVRQIKGGTDMVDPVHLFSCVAEDDVVKIINPTDRLADPQVNSLMTQAIQDRYDEHRNLVHANTVTHVLNDLMTCNHSVPMKDSGGVYWCPDEVVEMMSTLASHWNGCFNTRFKISAWAQTVPATHENFEKIRVSVLQDLENRYNKIRDSIDLNATMHDNGKASRTARCYEMKDVADRYQDVLGNDASKYKQMADDLVDMINEAAAMDMCS